MTDTAQRLTNALRTIMATWDDMIPVGPKVSIGPRISTQLGSKPPVNIVVVSQRRWMSEQVAAWCHVVIDDRELQHADVTQTDMPGMCDFLTRHVEWWAEHEAAGDITDELETIARRCTDIAGDVRRRRFAVAPCIGYATSDLGERVPCTGRIFAHLSSDQDVLPAFLACDVDEEHKWSAGEWHLIGRRLGKLDPIAAERLASYIRGA